jgi:hypothetical protein
LIEVEREIRKLNLPNTFFWVQFACCRETKVKTTKFNIPECLADYRGVLPEQLGENENR